MNDFFIKNKKSIIYIFSTVLVISLLLGVSTSNKLKKILVLEAGENFPSASDFIIKDKYEGSFITDISTIDTHKIGTYPIQISINNKTYETTLEIKDTTLPFAKEHSVTGWVNDTFTPENFLDNITDATSLNIHFKSEPNFSIPGIQNIVLVLEDEALNILELTTTLTLEEDKIPPVIQGIKDQSIFVGKTISYRKDVTVTDNKDSDIEIIIDSSTVDTKKPGVYEVLYSATDSSDNTTSASAKITVKEKPRNIIDREYVDELSDNVLAKILKDGMTDKEKLWAIFKWTKSHIAYTGYSDKSNWLIGAVQGIKNASGDCFNYYAVDRALLERAGFEVLTIVRVSEAPTRHYWLLVKYNGGWYHLDSTLTFKSYPFDCFLKTDAEVEAYTEWIWPRRQYYYTYDKTKYPEVATEVIN